MERFPGGPLVPGRDVGLSNGLRKKGGYVRSSQLLERHPRMTVEKPFDPLDIDRLKLRLPVLGPVDRAHDLQKCVYSSRSTRDALEGHGYNGWSGHGTL